MVIGGQMRIAFVSDWFLPRLGGIELQLKDLAVELQSRHCEVHVHTTTPGPTEVAGIPVTRTPARLAPGLGFAISPNLVETIRSELAAGRYTILHVHMSIVSPLGYAAIVAGRDLGLPTVVTFHSVLGFTSQVLRLADRLTGWSKWPLALTGVSERVASELRRAAPDLEVTTLPNGVNPDFWHVPRYRQDAPILAVSAMRLNRRKRPLALLHAFRRAQTTASRRQMKLCIAGMGPEAEAMQRYIARHDLQNDVTLLGIQPREALRDLYSRAHFFVLSSIQEAFGIAALEARCASLPVIAMRAAGCSDFLAGAGQFLADNDAELAAHIARLATDDVLREHLAAPDPGLDRFAWPEVVQAHLDCYARIAASSGRPR
jgi:glycosyltransferase involved in cell wall biosynthesis